MDERGFDNLARALAGGTSRRALLKLLTGGAAVGLLGVAGRGRADAALCRGPGVLCLKDAQCCSGLCNPAEHHCVCPQGTIPCGNHCIAPCAVLDQCHDVGVCDPRAGQCTNPLKADGTGCDDGNACTRTDTCQGGVCVGGDPVVCAVPDQCHLAGACDPASGQCSNPPKADGAPCDDGNACTQADTCQGGVCTSGAPVVCAASDQCHAAGTCDPATGRCSNPAKQDGTACDDGNACTQTDTCQAGVCVGGNPVVCTASDTCHDAGTCNPQTGGCSNPSKSDGAICGGGMCQSGQCVTACPYDGSSFCANNPYDFVCCGPGSQCLTGIQESICCSTAGGPCLLCPSNEFLCCSTNPSGNNACSCCNGAQYCDLSTGQCRQ